MTCFTWSITAPSRMSRHTWKWRPPVEKPLKFTLTKNHNFQCGGVVVTERQSWASRYAHKSCSHVHIPCPISLKFNGYDEASILNPWIWQSWTSSIAPPSYCIGHILPCIFSLLCPMCMKLKLEILRRVLSHHVKFHGCTPDGACVTGSGRLCAPK